MRIGFVGAGKVGCSLGRYFSAKHHIVGYASKNASSAEEAAELTSSKAFKSGVELLCECDALFITTPDSQIVPTWKSIEGQCESEDLKGKIICHCSGALPSTELSECRQQGAYAYSIHPLFAIPSKTTSIDELSRAFFTIEGDEKEIDKAASIVKEMGNPYQIIETAQKVRYHAAAALASNHVVALYRLACNELEKCGFSSKRAEQALGPLFLGNAVHIVKEGTVAALTGPAERGDTATIEKHLSCLEGRTLEVYRLLNEVLLQIAAEKHSQAK